MNQEFINRAKAAYDAWVDYEQGIATGSGRASYSTLLGIAQELGHVVGEGYQMFASDAFEGVPGSFPPLTTDGVPVFSRQPGGLEQLLVEADDAYRRWSGYQGDNVADYGLLLTIAEDSANTLSGFVGIAPVVAQVERLFHGVENVIGEYPNNREVVEQAVLRLLEALDSLFNR